DFSISGGSREVGRVVAHERVDVGDVGGRVERHEWSLTMARGAGRRCPESENQPGQGERATAAARIHACLRPFCPLARGDRTSVIAIRAVGGRRIDACDDLARGAPPCYPASSATGDPVARRSSTRRHRTNPSAARPTYMSVMNELDLDTYVSRSRALDLTGIAWDDVPHYPLSPEVVRTLRYMQ